MKLRHSWVERAALRAIVGVLAAAGVDAAEIVVLESSAARFPAGRVMSDAVAIDLAAGEVLVIVTEDARLVRLAGPYNGPPVGAPPDENAVRKTIERLVNGDEPRVGGLGAVRGIEGDDAPDTRPEPWVVHAELDGAQCALRGRPVELWREDAARSTSAEITAAPASAAATARWEAGSQRSVWPESLPPADDRVYLIRFRDVERSTAIRIRLLPGTVADSALAAAAWLAATGCSAQARLLLR